MYRNPTSKELKTLTSIWQEFIPDNSEQTNQIYNDLIEKYSEPHHAYHNVGHLVELFEYFEEHRSKLNDPKAVAIAFFFHDVIYDIGNPDNETQSAEYAQQALEKMNYSPDLVTRVVNLIEMTKTHEPTDENTDSFLMLDMDMAVIGTPAEQYQRYSQAIEAEYLSYYSPDQYYNGRLQFLSSFTQKERLFLTNNFEEHYGKQAHKNLSSEHSALQEKLDLETNRPSYT